MKCVRPSLQSLHLSLAPTIASRLFGRESNILLAPLAAGIQDRAAAPYNDAIRSESRETLRAAGRVERGLPRSPRHSLPRVRLGVPAIPGWGLIPKAGRVEERSAKDANI